MADMLTSNPQTAKIYGWSVSSVLLPLWVLVPRGKGTSAQWIGDLKVTPTWVLTPILEGIISNNIFKNLIPSKTPCKAPVRWVKAYLYLQTKTKILRVVLLRLLQAVKKGATKSSKERIERQCIEMILNFLKIFLICIFFGDVRILFSELPSFLPPLTTVLISQLCQKHLSFLP